MTHIKTIDLREGFMIQLEGHADTAPYGKDPVCAALSAYVYLIRDVLLQVEPLGDLNFASVTIEKGYAQFYATGQGQVRNMLMTLYHAVVKGLRTLSKQYPKAVTLEVEK